MIKRIKTKSTKENSVLDFVMELNQKYNIKNIKLQDKTENKKLEREKRKLLREKNLMDNYFNGHEISSGEALTRKNYKEDQENLSRNINLSTEPRLALRNNNKTITEFFKQKIPEKGTKVHFEKINNCEFVNINKFPQNILNVNCGNLQKNFICNKGKFIEFFDEQNKRQRKMPIFEEKEIKFCKSKIIPQLKIMKLDNDVLTEDEQLKDATNMLKDNIKEVIKNINSEGFEYLNKNLSRKLTFKKKLF